MLNCHTKETLNIAIYAFFSGKFLDVTKYACVKDLTNIMSVGKDWSQGDTKVISLGGARLILPPLKTI